MMLAEAVAKWSTFYSLDQKIVEAIIYQESKGKQYAYRLEEKFHKDKLEEKGARELAGMVPSLYHEEKLPSLYDEKILRASSFGYMQILGETARSILAFKGQYLTELFDTETNIRLGCMLLDKLLRRYRDKPEGERLHLALKDYNGSHLYPPLILSHVEHGRHLRIYR